MDADCEGRGSAVHQGPIMATILEFRQGHRTRTSPQNGISGSGEIVFFPGVRYERNEETARTRAKRRQRRRDRLEIDG